jgi:hypothetical protein
MQYRWAACTVPHWLSGLSFHTRLTRYTLKGLGLCLLLLSTLSALALRSKFQGFESTLITIWTWTSGHIPATSCSCVPHGPSTASSAQSQCTGHPEALEAFEPLISTAAPGQHVSYRWSFRVITSGLFPSLILLSLSLIWLYLEEEWEVSP